MSHYQEERDKMKIVGMDTKVVSSRGDIITYEEHCQRVITYTEEIKEKALQLTVSNPELSEYIRLLKPVFSKELYIEDTTCYMNATIQSPYEEITLPQMPLPLEEMRKNFSSTGLDENGHPILYYSFLSIPNSLKEWIIADVLMERFIHNTDLFLTYLKDEVIIDTFKWNFISSEQKGKCKELIFQHYVPENTWLATSIMVRVLVGTYKDIEEELHSSKARYANSNLIVVDIDKQSRKADEVYTNLTKDLSYKNTYVWGYGSFVLQFYLGFRTYAQLIGKLLNIDTDNAYKLGDLLSNTLDSQDKLIGDLRTMPTGNGKAYEELVKKILEFLFSDEFTPFKVKDQIATSNRKRIRDFIIDNRNPRNEFWRDLKSVRGVEKILFDAKNYKNSVEYTEITSTLRYLKNKAFGKLIFVISRYGVKDYVETTEDYAEEGRVIIYLSDEDLITMINLKRQGKSPTFLLEEKYYDFLDSN